MDLCNPYKQYKLIDYVVMLQYLFKKKNITIKMRFVRNIHIPIFSSTDRSIQWTQRDLRSAISRSFFLMQGRRWASFFPQIVYSAREDLPATILSAGPCHDRPRPLTTLIWRPRCSCNTPAIIFPVTRIYPIVRIAQNIYIYI